MIGSLSTGEHRALLAENQAVRQFPQLETKRLLLRELVPDDAEALFRNYADGAVTEHFMEPLARLEDAATIVEEYRAAYGKGTGLIWAITLRSQPTLIGTCGYEIFSWPDLRGDIGYDLGRAYWGQGVMREALHAVIDYSFASLGLQRIQAYVLAENARSIGLLKSLGFQVEGRLREHRHHRGRLRDNMILALLKREWNPRRGMIVEGVVT